MEGKKVVHLQIECYSVMRKKKLVIWKNMHEFRGFYGK